MKENPEHRVAERVEAILQRLAERRATERVFLTLFEDQARDAAKLADIRAKAGQKLGPLDGVIVSVKGVFDIAGEITTAGSARRLTAEAASADAPVIRRLKQAGAIIVGSTNLTEFCFTSDGLNRHFGTPGNARDPHRIPGGSSSGAAVSVAEGTCDLAIGTDTGGSVRIPAALNGVVGFKPTARRVPLEGVFPLSPTLDSVGPVAATVDACAAADLVMAGEAASVLPDIDLAGFTLAVVRGQLMDGLDAEVTKAFQQTVTLLEHRGARIVEVEIDDLVGAMRGITQDGSLASVEAAAVHADWLIEGDASVSPRVADPLGRRLSYPAWKYQRLLQGRRGLCARMDERLAAVDVLLLPTVPIVAPLLAPLEASDELASQVDGRLLRNPQIVNQFDLTAISLPMAGDGLPTGLMLIGRHGADRHLLATARSVERVLGR